MKSIDLMDLYLQINKAEQNINYLIKNLVEVRHTLRDMDDMSRFELQDYVYKLRDLENHLQRIGNDHKPF